MAPSIFLNNFAPAVSLNFKRPPSLEGCRPADPPPHLGGFQSPRRGPFAQTLCVRGFRRAAARLGQAGGVWRAAAPKHGGLLGTSKMLIDWIAAAASCRACVPGVPCSLDPGMLEAGRVRIFVGRTFTGPAGSGDPTAHGHDEKPRRQVQPIYRLSLTPGFLVMSSVVRPACNSLSIENVSRKTLFYKLGITVSS
jgi:hypothetical protein